MSLDRAALIEACRREGTVARVVVGRVHGSAPREAGAAMLVWRDGQAGTIGGGALEYSLAAQARTDLTPGSYAVTRHALGPDLGQCCGGAVEIVSEVFDRASAESLPDDVFARGPGAMPLSIQRVLAQARRGDSPVTPQIRDGWMIEPVQSPGQPLWIWGAGHVGRALVKVLTPLPGYHISWIDTDASRFPPEDGGPVERLIAQDPGTLVPYAPREADHLILTYSHEIDLDLCHRLLGHGFRSAGLIGSRTKWARFRKRLAALGHAPAAIERITCPIGTPAFGKHPQAIAIGVAAALLAPACARLQEGRRA
jgi:xanthine dehydrogenase accessory factor